MLNQLMLEFERDDARAGFRLHRLEVWNWGTFHGKIWAMEPAGHTSLLTGANGSGKSTLVDALLTLLVPNTRRNYNQASGSDFKRERDERSYVLGAYGRVRTEESLSSKTQYLRTRDDYSVLLAQFHNRGYRTWVTLAQVFWLQDATVRKFFVAAAAPLGIERHFSNFSDINELKRRLRAMPVVEVFDQFNEYSRRFRKIFGLRTEKALDLFNQTVTIKEIGDLNGFVRTHMLDRTDVQDKIQQLELNYENLTRSHDAILKAQSQLELLRPLMDEASHYERVESGIRELQTCADAVPAWFAGHRTALFQGAVDETKRRLTQVRHRIDSIGEDLELVRRQQRDLEIAISTDAAGQRMRELDLEIRRMEERASSKRRQAEKYDRLAARLNLPAYGDENVFYASADEALKERRAIDERADELGKSAVELQIRVRNFKQSCDELEREVESLRLRKSQIPDQNLGIRSRMLEELGIPEEEIPFVGELLKVRDEEREWEGAIERLLHNLALRLLVPEKHYKAVNRYVNETNLRGRIVYHKVSDRRSYTLIRTPDEDALIHKMEIKPGTQFYDWIRNELSERFDYVCCNDLEKFQRESHAITKNGLIKGGNAMHEKDDRRKIDDRRHFVLGWNNSDKIGAIETEQTGYIEKLKETADALRDIDSERKRLDSKKEWLQDFSSFQHFSEIDWRANDVEMEKLQDQKRELEQSSDRLKLLRSQLTDISMRIKDKEKDRSNTEREANDLERDIFEYRKKLEECEVLLGLFTPEDLARYALRIEAHVGEKSYSLQTIDSAQRDVLEHYLGAISEEKAVLHRMQSKIEKSMLNFKYAYPTETADMDASIACIGEFSRLLQAIEWEDLPRHERRFKELLDEKVIAEIAFFKSTLERQIEEIEASVSNLNTSLQAIDYTPSTFIQLACEQNRDPEILDLRNTLSSCLPEAGIPATAESNEASFQKIKALIERFTTEERWTQKVTDVRNWLNFSASERYKEDNTEKHYYSDSSGKSGGQKAKLAYTILASAIAYQFGLDWGTARSKSFRFVVVDEAFSKSDEANARYAMELFRNLNLQLLVVTPPKSNDIQVVEPYIAACHYVTNSSEENDSRVYNLSMAQYLENKEKFIQSEMDEGFES